MASTLSEEEFQRLQNQLLELRTKNYSLEEKNMRCYNELKQVHLSYQKAKIDLEKALKTIQRSKVARDFDQVLQENERLQLKLQSQEDEFRLQNETLVEEARYLTSMVETLKKDLDHCKSESQSEKGNLDELLRLQAENNTLKRLLHEQGGTSNDSNAESRLEAELESQTRVEELAILKEKIAKVLKSHQEDVSLLQHENDKLNEKLKKKQESLVQLQEEKENMYMEFKQSQESLSAEKDNEIRKLKDQMEKLKLQAFDNRDSDFHERPEATVAFLEHEKASFEYVHQSESKLPSVSEIQNELGQIKEELAKAQEEVKELTGVVATLTEEKEQMRSEKTDLESILKEKIQLAEKRKTFMDEMNAHMLETTNKHSKEIENLTQQLLQEQEALQKIIDKERETKLELLECQNKVNNLKKDIESLKDEHTSATEDYKKVLDKAEEEKLSIQKKFEAQEEEYKVSIDDLNNSLKSQSEDFNVQLEILRAERNEFEDKVLALDQEIKDLNDERKIIEKKNLSSAKDLKRQLLSERKRAEKLQERLQAVLNEQNQSIVDDIIHSSTSTEKPKGDTSSVSSWSYVSAEIMDKEGGKENTIPSEGSSCDRDSPSRMSPNTLENETSNLLSKVTYLQQKNWTLEEKVNHLEVGNEAMADDIMKKTAIIQFYCMEGRSNVQSTSPQDKLTIKRIVDFIKDKGDENLREVNRKMQRMLEETLTKNMYLQKDIETLTNKVSSLTKTVEAMKGKDIDSSIVADKL